MATLADIEVSLTVNMEEFQRSLKQAEREINNFARSVNDSTRDASRSMNDLNRTVGQSSSNIANSARDMGQQFANASNSIQQSARRSQYATSTLARTLGTDTESMRRVLDSATNDFHNFSMVGQQVSESVKENFGALPSHLQRYVQRLKDAGQSTAEFAALNDMYGKRIVARMAETNNYLQNKATDTSKIIGHLDEQRFSGLSQSLLQIGESLEQRAKQGTALNLALQRLGEGTSLKKLQDEIMFIEKGVARANSAFIGFGLASVVATAGLVLLSNEVDGRLIGAFEEFKRVWTDALRPFVEVFTDVVLGIFKVVNGLGSMMASLAETNPLVSQMIWGFAYLVLLFGTLLAPLAVAIGLFAGMNAVFAALWPTIAPFVLGILTVIGYAALLAAAFVLVTVAITQMLKHSELFASAWNGLWGGIAELFNTVFLAPIMAAWDKLKESFLLVVSTITGGATSVGGVWKWLGDIFSNVINLIASVLLPMFELAFTVLGTVVTEIINGLASVFQWLAGVWQENGDTISSVAKFIWDKIVEAFSAVGSFISSQIPTIQDIIVKAFELIKNVIGFVMDYIVPVVSVAFGAIYKVVEAIMPAALWLIEEVWDGIKSAIENALNLVVGILDWFSALFTGDWEGLWDATKLILESAIGLILDLIELSLYGKAIKFIKAFGKDAIDAIKGSWDKIVSNTSSFVKSIFDKISSTFNSIKDFIGLTSTAILLVISTWFADMFNEATDGMSSFTTKIEEGFNKAVDWATETKDKVVKAIKDMVSDLIDALDFEWSLPKLKLPSISVSGSFSLDPPSVPSFGINWNASGNIFNGASVLGGGQGVGEAGAEVVMPIQHKRYMKPYASMVASMLAESERGNGEGQTFVQNITINSPTALSPSEIAKKQLQASRRLALEWR